MTTTMKMTTTISMTDSIENNDDNNEETKKLTAVNKSNLVINSIETSPDPTTLADQETSYR